MRIGSASRVYPAIYDFSQGVLEAADIPLCSGLQVCSPPRSFLPLRILPQGSRGFYVRAYRALLPPHAPDMLTVRIQVIDGTGTFTLSDSQPCRLLHWDRNRARPAVGEGFPFLLFRLQDGFTVSPWLTFPEAPL